MSNRATYMITNFKSGDFMVWAVCSQTASTGTITLKDDSTTYFTANKSSGASSLQLLAQSSATYLGGSNLRLEVVVNDSACDIKQCIQSSNIVDDCSNIVGYIYDYCIEDWVDKDYNDYYVNLVAWHHKG